MKDMRVKIIGVGGIGCALLPILARFLNFKEGGARITLIDGDSFEPKNQERQSFNKLGNKAEVTVERLEKEFERIRFRAEPYYISEETVSLFIQQGDIVFLCVDNHATRKIVSDYCERLSDVILISGGNEYTDGNIQILFRRNNRNITLPLANSFHPEIENPKDLTPEDGCDELMESKPQLLITNNAIAAMMLNAFYAYLTEKLDYDEVYVDILTNNTRSVKRT